MKSLFTQLMTAVIFTFLITFSCKKESNPSGLTPQEEEQASVASSQSDAESEAVFNDVFDNVLGVNNDVGLAGVGVFGRVAQSGTSNDILRTEACFTVSISRFSSNEPFPLRIVVDFGTGCTGRDGHTRYGKIITEYTGRLIVPGKSATTTFDHFRYDSISVEGTHKLTNTGTALIRQFTVEVSGARLTMPNGNYSQWNNHRIITQVEGLITPELPLDDTFTITGYSSGEIRTNIFATTWESTITEPLRKRFVCHWISKGVVKVIRKNLSADSKWVVTLNYGSGDCDNKAVLIINNIEHQITLR
jgi:hypothetical protein